MQSVRKKPYEITERITSSLLGDDNKTSNYLSMSLKNYSTFENNSNEVEPSSNKKDIGLRSKIVCHRSPYKHIDTDDNGDSEDKTSTIFDVQGCVLVL